MKNAETQNLNQELMRAASQGNLEAVKKLMLCGADIYFKDHQRRYCLVTCCRKRIFRYFRIFKQFEEK